MKYLLLFLLPLQILAQDCSDVKKEVDKFEDKTTYMLFAGFSHEVSLFKIATSKDTSITMSLTVRGNTPSVGEKGVKILLSDGSKIEKPNERIKCDVDVSNGYRYTYQAFVSFSKAEVARLLKLYITDYRLYIHDGSFPEWAQKSVMQDLKCIVDAK